MPHWRNLWARQRSGFDRFKIAEARRPQVAPVERAHELYQEMAHGRGGRLWIAVPMEDACESTFGCWLLLALSGRPLYLVTGLSFTSSSGAFAWKALCGALAHGGLS